MARTYRRRAAYNGLSSTQLSKLSGSDFHMSEFHGINDDDNFVNADQVSFADCNNLYIDDDGQLRQRPPLKEYELQPETERNIVKFQEVDGVLVVYDGDSIFVRHPKTKTFTKLFTVGTKDYFVTPWDNIYVIFMSDRILGFEITDVGFNTYTTSDLVYIPEQTSGGTETEPLNMFTDKVRKTFTFSETVHTPTTELIGNTVTIDIGGKSYSIVWQQYTEKVLMELCSEKSFYDVQHFGDNYLAVEASSTRPGYNIKIYVSKDGRVFDELPLPENGRLKYKYGYGDTYYDCRMKAQLSQDGKFVLLYTNFTGNVEDTVNIIEYKKQKMYFCDLTKSILSWTASDIDIDKVLNESGGAYRLATGFNIAVDGKGATGSTLGAVVSMHRIFPIMYERYTPYVGSYPIGYTDPIQSNTAFVRSISLNDDIKAASNLMWGVFLIPVRSFKYGHSRPRNSTYNDSNATLINEVSTKNCDSTVICICNLTSRPIQAKLYYITVNIAYDTVTITDDNIAVVGNGNSFIDLKQVWENDIHYQIIKSNPSSWNYSVRFNDYSFSSKLVKSTMSSDKTSYITKTSSGISKTTNISISFVSSKGLDPNNYPKAFPETEENFNTAKQRSTASPGYLRDIYTSPWNVTVETQAISDTFGHYAKLTGNIIAYNGEDIIDENGLLDIDSDTSSYTNLIIKPDKVVYFDKDNFEILKTNKLYSSVLTKPITINVTTGSKYNFFIPTHAEDFITKSLSIGKNLYQSVIKSNKIYIPENSKVEFPQDITGLIKLTDDTLGVFTSTSTYLYKYNADFTSQLPVDSFTLEKSKLGFGLLEGNDLKYSLDGQYILLPTFKGLTAMSYQQFIYTSEQTYKYLSDQIASYYKEWTNNYVDNVKIVNYRNWIILYKTDSPIIWVYDIRNSSWWKWTFKNNVTNISVIDNDLILTVRKSMSGVSTHLYIIDFSDKESFKDTGTQLFGIADFINWSIKSQKLHFSAPTYYKHIRSLTTIVNRNEVEDDLHCTYDMKFLNYKNGNNTDDIDSYKFEANGLVTQIQKVNFIKTNAFQFEMSSNEDFTNTQFAVSDIVIKFRVTEASR